MRNQTVWALTTFSLGITCGIIGHYLPAEGSIPVIPMFSVIFAMIGAAGMGETQ